MKRNYFLNVIGITAMMLNLTFGQAPTIVSGDMPQVGYIYYNNSDTVGADRSTFTVSAGSGTSQIWDYSLNFVTTYPDPLHFVVPSSGQGYANFPTATMAVFTGGNWGYFISNASGFSSPGGEVTVGTSTTTVVLTPNQIEIPTPYTLNSTNSNIYASTFTVVNGTTTYQIHHHANRTILADAYGSLTTPGGTFSSTLRVKTHEVTLDSVFSQVFSSWVFVTKQLDSTTTYAWLQNSSTCKLMQISLNATNVVTKAQYLNSFSNEVSEISNPASLMFSVFPNPATNQAHFTYNNKSDGIVYLGVFDLTGREVIIVTNNMEKAGTHNYSIPVELLPKGFYLVKLLSSGQSLTKKLLVE